ncbi:MAG: NAD(+)/NADH kinase [Clostridia bacterium]|nr:NAD(+)/NADH kinase [Clostridia bacterium]
MIGFFYRETNDRSLSCLNKLERLCAEAGLAYCDLKKTDLQDVSDVSLIVVLGGDGTVLKASKVAADNIPIVAVNTGTVGFLTSYEESNVEDLIDDILNDRLSFVSRQFMEISVNDNVYYALNDGVIAKSFTVDHQSECVKMMLKINGNFVDNYVADGLILSTPTGSTAYAISAGGPVMEPNVNAFVVAPICAHSLHSRPIVYSSDLLAEVFIHETSKDCALYVDGEFVEILPKNTKISIKKSDKYARICDSKEGFFSKLSHKLNKWSTNEF